MSRCFPYPPPGFIGKKASDPLIDSIKLQKEKVDKQQRKEKRREKKEKKKEKKEKKEKVVTKQTEVGKVANKDGRNWMEVEGVLSEKRKREDTEQLEGSSLTEEHERPLNSQNPSYSSDGTQNSNKRRKQEASLAVDGRSHGNIIRIKLPLQKHKESESRVSKEQLEPTSVRNVQNKESDVKASKEQGCSTSGRNEMQEERPCSVSGWMDHFDYPGQDLKRTRQVDAPSTAFRTNDTLQGLPFGPSNRMGCSAAGNIDNFVQDHIPSTSGSVPGSCSTSGDKKLQKKISKYNSLIENLYQMAVPSEPVDNDCEDWLFGGKPANKGNVVKQIPVNSGVTCSSSSTLYPRARYLEEAKIYALPFTVPF